MCLPGTDGDGKKGEDIDLAKKVSVYSGPIKLHVVNFTDIQLHDGDDPTLALDVIDTLYKENNPDLIVFLGDLIHKENTKEAIINSLSLLVKYKNFYLLLKIIILIVYK